MKKFLYKITALSVALIFAFAAAHAEDLNRNQHKVFQVKQGHNLAIDAQFSDINIVKNTTDEVEIDVTIEVEGDSKRDRKLFEAVKVILSQSGNTVSVTTEFPGRMNHSDLDIDIKIKAPMYMQTQIDLQYGNLYLEELTGAAELDLRYSSFKSDVLASKDNKLEMAYMDHAVIGYVNGALIDFSYSEVTIKKATTLSGRSAYSEIAIKEVDDMNLSMTKYDEWEIEKIQALTATSRYAEFEIGYLKTLFVLNANFGEVEIEHTGANFEKIELDLSYTGCELGIDKAASYMLKADGSYADIDYDEDRFKGAYESKMMSVEIDGTIGSSPKGKVLIDTSYGDVEL